MSTKKLENSVFAFFEEHLKRGDVIVLGLSGGGDSLALLYLLLEYRKKQGFQLHLAHVNHGAREEAMDEARQLEELARTLDLPFHLSTLRKIPQGNQEDQWRKHRYTFFADLCETLRASALVLGHHQDDQAETILKRVLEGASLSRLGGMSQSLPWKAGELWRPLLDCKKSEIEEWLRKKDLVAFEDPTNRSKKYLRGRLRTTIFPQLDKDFGKGVRASLVTLGQEANELRDFIEEELSFWRSLYLTGPFGTCIDFSSHSLPHPYLLREIIRDLSRHHQRSLHRSQIDTLVGHLRAGEANKCVKKTSLQVHVDRYRLFFVTTQPVTEGKKGGHSKNWGQWQLIPGVEKKQVKGWREVWRGSCCICLPRGSELMPYSESLHFKVRGLGKTLRQFWTDSKVPTFMRTWAPLVVRKREIEAEFLSTQAFSDSLSPLDQQLVRVSYCE